jgi:hypothetical protein
MYVDITKLNIMQFYKSSITFCHLGSNIIFLLRLYLIEV